jgi:NTE family protein
MLEALYERGIAPELIVGASAGALNGAYIASRRQEVATARKLGTIWRKLTRARLFPLGPLSSLAALVGWGNHLACDRGLRGLLERHLQFERLQDAPIPLHVVAVDALTGREVLLSDGPALDAILASAAIPGVLPPVRWGGMELIDGGVANNTPISHAVALGADELYVLPTVLPTGDPCALPKAPRGALGAVMHTMTLLVQHRLMDDIATFGERVRLVVLPPPCPLEIQPTDFGHALALIAQARRKARRFLQVHDDRLARAA